MRGQIHLLHNSIILEEKRNEGFLHSGRKIFMRKRYSRKFQWHIEVVAVKNRSFILLHPANSALNELNGCIAPVTKLSEPGLGLQSRQAFAKVKNYHLINSNVVWEQDNSKINE